MKRRVYDSGPSMHFWSHFSRDSVLQCPSDFIHPTHFPHHLNSCSIFFPLSISSFYIFHLLLPSNYLSPTIHMPFLSFFHHPSFKSASPRTWNLLCTISRPLEQAHLPLNHHYTFRSSIHHSSVPPPKAHDPDSTLATPTPFPRGPHEQAESAFPLFHGEN